MRSLKTRIIPLLFLSLVKGNAVAGEHWYMSATLNGMAGSYSGSEERDNLYSGSFWLNADYLDTFSMAFAYTGFNINFKDTGNGPFSLKQDGYAGRLQIHSFSDSLRGRMTYQLVMHGISNNDPTGATDNVTVIAPKIAYTNYSKTLYLDLEYAWSDYANNNGLTMQQLTPTFGFGFNDGFDFIRLRGYFISSSDSQLTQGKDAYSAASVRWTHWFGPGGFIGMDNFFVDVLGGQRIYAVDNDVFSVYNLADVQQSSALLGLSWRPSEDIDITAVGGVENYENRLISNTYSQPYIYLSLTAHW